jgi:hypothetical protein
MPEKYARIKLKITGAKRQELRDMTECEAIAEGFKDWEEFTEYFVKLNPEATSKTEVWAYAFERVKC